MSTTTHNPLDQIADRRLYILVGALCHSISKTTDRDVLKSIRSDLETVIECIHVRNAAAEEVATLPALDPDGRGESPGEKNQAPE